MVGDSDITPYMRMGAWSEQTPIEDITYECGRGDFVSLSSFPFFLFLPLLHTSETRCLILIVKWLFVPTSFSKKYLLGEYIWFMLCLAKHLSLITPAFMWLQKLSPITDPSWELVDMGSQPSPSINSLGDIDPTLWGVWVCVGLYVGVEVG